MVQLLNMSQTLGRLLLQLLTSMTYHIELLALQDPQSKVSHLIFKQLSWVSSLFLYLSLSIAIYVMDGVEMDNDH